MKMLDTATHIKIHGRVLDVFSIQDFYVFDVFGVEEVAVPWCEDCGHQDCEDVFDVLAVFAPGNSVSVPSDMIGTLCVAIASIVCMRGEARQEMKFTVGTERTRNSTDCHSDRSCCSSSICTHVLRGASSRARHSNAALNSPSTHSPVSRH